jgi:hypothetical protein
MITKIMCVMVAGLAFGATAANAQPPGTLAPKGLIITRTSTGSVSSVRTIGGYAPGASTIPSNSGSQVTGGGNRNLNAPGGQNFFLRNSVNSQNSRNSRQVTQSRQTTQSVCNGKGLCWSDSRLKRNAELIGHLSNGINLYKYSYLGSSRLYVGVMAQEVSAVVPDAVQRGAGGYMRVDYRQLGLHLQTWEKWQQSHVFPPWGL